MNGTDWFPNGYMAIPVQSIDCIRANEPPKFEFKAAEREEQFDIPI